MPPGRYAPAYEEDEEYTAPTEYIPGSTYVPPVEEEYIPAEPYTRYGDYVDDKEAAVEGDLSLDAGYTPIPGSTYVPPPEPAAPPYTRNADYNTVGSDKAQYLHIPGSTYVPPAPPGADPFYVPGSGKYWMGNSAEISPGLGAGLNPINTVGGKRGDLIAQLGYGAGASLPARFRRGVSPPRPVKIQETGPADLSTTVLRTLKREDTGMAQRIPYQHDFKIDQKRGKQALSGLFGGDSFIYDIPPSPEELEREKARRKKMWE
jgi:hypothetical protein